MTESNIAECLVRGSHNLNRMKSEIKMICGLVISIVDKEHKRGVCPLEQVIDKQLGRRASHGGWSLMRRGGTYVMQYHTFVHSPDWDTCFAFTSERPDEQRFDAIQAIHSDLSEMVEWLCELFFRLRPQLHTLLAASDYQFDSPKV